MWDQFQVLFSTSLVTKGWYVVVFSDQTDDDYVVHSEIRNRFPSVWTVTDPFGKVFMFINNYMFFS